MKFFMAMALAGCLATLGARGDVWQDLAAYQYGGTNDAGAKANQLLQETPVAQHGAIEDALIKIVASAGATPDGKAFACRMLQQVATEKAIPAAAGLLTDEVLSLYARLVLERLAVPKADAALRAALDKAPDKAKVGIIGSLGERRDALAVKPLDELSRHADPAVAAAALRALGKIGGSAAADSLLNAKVAENLKPTHMEALAACLRTLNEPEAAALCEKVLAVGTPSSRIAALEGLFRADEKKAALTAAAFLKGEDETLRRGALTLVACGAGTPATTRALADLLGGLPELPKAGLIMALGGRGDPSALGAVTGCASDTNAAIREAAFSTLSKIGNESTVKLLLESADPKANEAVSKMTGPYVNSCLIKALEDSKLQVPAVKALAARSSSEAVPPLIKMIGASDAGVRKAVWAGLASLATEDDLTGIAAAAFAVKDEQESSAALSAVKRICAQSRDKGKCFGVVSAYYDRATPQAKGSILEMGPAIGTPAALELERKALKSGDKELCGTAVRALAAWENESAAADLLDLAQNAPSEKERLLTLRGYIQMAAMKEFNLNSNKRMEMFKKADALAKRIDEKRLILGGLPLAGSAEALSMVSAYWDNDQLRKEAEQTGLKMAEKLGKKHPAEVKALADKLLASKNASVTEKAKKVLADMGK